MDRLALLLSFAIVWLSLSYVLFTSQQYFSVTMMLVDFAIALSSCAVFVVFYRRSASGKLVSDVKTDRKMVAFLAVVTLLVLIEVFYNSGASPVFGSLPIVVLLASSAVAFSIIGIYAVERLTKGMRSYKLLVAAIIAIAIVAGITYFMLYGFRHVNWSGIDELAYNYYAAELVTHGSNPYLFSMQPILQQNGIFPTVQLNGTFEYAYDYPALSFLPYAIIPALGIKSFFVFILIVIFLAIFASWFIYYRSGYNKLVLIPVAVWLFMTYTLVGTMNQYLAISVLFLLAYVERKRVVVSGILLGLAASIIQLAWFAIPFLLVLVYREYGSKPLLKCTAFAVLAFLLANGYFLAVTPKVFVENVFAVFGLTKLAFYGPNIMQLLVSYYGVPSWYSAAISGVTIIAALVLFYLYTDTLRPLVAVLPAFIFFLSWRNISIYGLPFIPVIIAIYYIHDKDKRAHDILNDRKPILYAIVVLAVVFALVAVVSHGPYAKSSTIKVDRITPIIYSQPGFACPCELGGLKVDVTNNANYTQPISFYVISRNPDNDEYILSPSLNMALPAHSSYNYTLQYQISPVANDTEVYVFAFSQYYITSERYKLQLAGR